MTRKSPDSFRGGSTIPSFFGEGEELLPGLILRFTRPPAEPTPCLALIDLTVLAERMASPGTGQAPSSLLSPVEQSRYAGFAYPKRQREWLGGRLVCKFALLRLAVPPVRITMPDLSILPAANGAPLLSCPSLPTWSLPAISISHSDRYAVAMAVWSRSCGIDLQKTTPQILRVADRFAEPAEMELLRKALPDLAETQRLTLLWSAKEALKKGVRRDQPALFQGVTLVSVTCGPDLVLRLRYPGDGGLPTTVAAVALDDFFLAYITAPHHA
jgi:4'-phosphopantetheinyl transferase EntD